MWIQTVCSFQSRRGPRRRGARFVTCRVKLSFGSRENEEKEIEEVNYAKDENNYGDHWHIKNCKKSSISYIGVKQRNLL